MMKTKKRGNRQGTSRGRPSKTSPSTRRGRIRRAESTNTKSPSSRRKTTASSGKLDKNSAIAALKKMGFKVDAKGQVDTAQARKVAEGAAVSAAQALGTNILKADGSIDTAKARDAIGKMLGFSIERDGAVAQAEAVQRSRQAAIETAKSMNVDIRDESGNIDTAKAIQVAELSLDLKVVKAKQLGRREAVDALNISLDAMTSSNPESRRAANDVMEKLMSSSVLVDGKISRRKALDASKTAQTKNTEP